MCDHAPNREAAMVRLSEKVWCDPCIVPLVKALNDGGLETVWSCCGHGRRPSIVGLVDGRQVVVVPTMDEAETLLAGYPDINATPDLVGALTALLTSGSPGGAS